ncbi:hypothetical protein LIER_25021 [Lithospermum erythrorhizon]|uniref:Mitochondrial protein n=1 Tax=Lithospermum erythrorhizon TaxID=34254 RepID=A0AAV3R5E3_LITER
MIGSLLYLTASRPDIAYSIGVCARFQVYPKESHLNHVKRIIKYVNGIVEYGLLYTFDMNSTLVGFCNADWAGNTEDRKSTSGGCFFVGNNLVLEEYNVRQGVMTLYCDNMSAINISKNPQLADIFTKAIDAAQFESLRSSLGLCVIDK